MIIFPSISELSPSPPSAYGVSGYSDYPSDCHGRSQGICSNITRLAKHKSTPIKKEPDNALKALVETERSFIADGLTPYCHSNIDLVDFAVHVWGVERDTATAILGSQWILDDFQMKIYSKVLSSSVFKETDLHEPFRKIAEALLGDMSKKGYSVNHCEFWNREGKAFPPASRPTTRSKGLNTLTYDEPAPPRPSWANVRNVFDFKGKPPPKKPEPYAPKAKRAFRSLPPLPEDRPLTLDYPTAAYTSAKILNRSTGPKKAASQNINPLKRPSDSDAGDSQGSRQAAKRQRFVQSHQQAASYALECFAANSRHYVVCIAVNSWDIMVLYFDRTLVLQVAEFNFEVDPGALALVLYGTHVCDLRHTGFDPNLRAGPASFPLAEANEDEHPVETPIGSYFHFEHLTEDNHEGSKIAVKKIYKVTEVLSSTSDLIGRATAVYGVRECSPINNELSSERYALKLSWPLKSRVSEIDVVQRLKDKLSTDLHAHLPSLEFSTDFDAHRLQLPWLQLNLNFTSTNHQERVLRVLSEKKYSKLWEAGSVEAFRQAWLDCVECHHQAWEVGKTMHRDLSENNLMLYWDKDGNVKGVLNDWDMAEFTDSDEERDLTTAAHYRTGTPPFMAVDLLCMKDQTCRHSFRHELESLFYILLWAALHYDVVNKIRYNTLDVVEKWQGTVTEIHTAKSLFWGKHNEAEAVFARVRPEFAETLDNWIRPLWGLFGEARALNLLRQYKKAKKPSDKDKFMDEKINFETFMEMIEEKPRWACVDSASEYEER